MNEIAINYYNESTGGVDNQSLVMLNGLSRVSIVTFTSSSSSDISQTYQINGLDPAFRPISETITLNGTTGVNTTKEFVQITDIENTGGILVGNLTISDSEGRAITVFHNSVNSGVGTETNSIHNLLDSVYGSPFGELVYYVKFFLSNNSGSTITDGALKELTDNDRSVKFAMEPTPSLTTTIPSLYTRPSIFTADDFNRDEKSIPTLTNGQSIGVWLELTISEGIPNPQLFYQLEFTSSVTDLIFQPISPLGSGETLGNTLSNRALEAVNVGGNPLNYVELAGAKLVEKMFYEPDPTTFRDQFYYNARLNRLYKKLVTRDKPVWKLVR